ncbi:SDR family oxidoreductase [Demequina sp. NBRC 110056]|uniref:SDR family oxidoreductase n=1 Tax=Demequina sp. NBRC 110056 TaxID=1570345 RepID=UPI000A0494E6|nr:SDR family oxidoreductase [Demequina sp. NBRC 110056]
MKTNEVAVLIGTGSIGLAAARRAAVGRQLLLADYNEAQLAATAELLQGEGYDVHTHVTDVSDPDAVAALADAAAALGPVTRLVHAAGVSPVQASTERVIEVDLLGTAYVLEEFGRVVSAGGSGIVIASMAGHMGPGFPSELEHALAYTPTAELAALPQLEAGAVGDSGAAYTLAKRANALRVLAAAVPWGARGARVNCLSPGIISTPLARDEMNGPMAEGYQAMIATSAAGRMGTPSEVGDLAAFLFDQTGGFITGADILMDGGVIAAMKAGQLG